MWSAGQGDNQERFLADLRALRDAAAIGYEELAARAHFPSSILKEAENGPGLPGLPILAAYVRACDADVPEWEERWRRLAYEAETDPGLPVRAAGASPAAVAGARAGITIGPPDVFDPERIRAALRGGTADHATRDTGRPQAAALGRADPETVPTGPATTDGPAARNSGAGWGDSVWNARAGRDGGSARDARSGRGSGWETETPWDTAPGWESTVAQDTAPANGNHHATYTSSLLDPPAAEAFDPEVPSPATLDDSEPTRWSADSKVASSVTADSEPAWRPADTGHAALDDAEPAPDPVQAAESAAADVPAPPQAATEPVRAPALPRVATQPVRAPVPTAAPDESHRDRFFPIRLIAIMVVAAIIGSVLVLLIR
jgi:hypothetical protein